MSEYIERGALESKAVYMHGFGKNKYVPLKAIQEAKAADVVEVKHGRWVLEREPDGTPYCFHCSVCDDDFNCRTVREMLDTTYCSYIHCPFTDCEHHANHLKKYEGTGVEVRVSWLCDSCRRYIGWLIEQGQQAGEREEDSHDKSNRR